MAPTIPICSILLIFLSSLTAKSAENAESEIARRDAEAALIEAYLEESSCATIEAVEVNLSEIRVSGKIDPTEDGPFHLAEVRPQEKPWVEGPFIPSGSVHVLEVAPEGEFDLRLPREFAERDRITSRWCVLNG